MELLDVYNEQGEKTGKVVERGSKNEIFKPEEHIAVAIIYIENNQNQFLIQKTSVKKGGEYSSTGGHVAHNEDPQNTIIREVKEELGIDIRNDKIMNFGFLLFDFPVRFIFYLKKDIDLNDIVLQKEEVDSVSYKSIDEINNLIEKGLMHKAHAKGLQYVLDYKKKNNIK